MLLPLVAIDVDSAAAPDAKGAVLTSCQKVVGLARCVDVGHALAPSSRYLAIVRAIDDGKLRVQLQSRADHRVRGERDLAFLTADLQPEHWQSAGLVVTSLLAEAEHSTPTPPTWSPPASAPAAARRDDAAGRWVRVGLGVAAAPGFDFDPWRFGPSLSVAFAARASFIYPLTATRWLGSEGRVRSDIACVALGLGARLIRQPNVELGLEATGLAEVLLVSAAVGGQTERTFQARYGARLGLASSVELTSPLHAYAGVDLTWLGRRSVVELAGQRLGTEPRYVPGFEGGIRVFFF